MAMSPQVKYRFNAIPKIENSNYILQKSRKKIPKSHMEAQKTPNIKSILSKINDARGITIPNFKLDYRAIVNKKKKN
jgi:hypothetical protein